MLLSKSWLKYWHPALLNKDVSIRGISLCNGGRAFLFFFFWALKNNRRYHVNVFPCNVPVSLLTGGLCFQTFFRSCRRLSWHCLKCTPSPSLSTFFFFFYISSPRAKPHVYINQCNVQLTPSKLCSSCTAALVCSSFGEVPCC